MPKFNLPVSSGFSESPRRTLLALAAAGALLLDFTTGAMPAGMAFTRSSAATQFNAAGNLDWCPMNLCTNSTGVGGGVGVAPTNWGLVQGVGITVSVTGVGAEADGIPYVEFRFVGTNSGGSQTFPAVVLQSGVLGPSAGIGARLTGTAQVRVIAGTAAQLDVYCQGVTSGGSFNETGSGGGHYTPTASWGTISTVGGTAYSNASTAKANLLLQSAVSAGASIDITFRVRQPQMNYGTTAQPYVATSGSAYYGPRLDYDPITHAPLGLLMEEVRTNLLTLSRDVQANGTTTVLNAVGIDGVANTATTVTTNATGQPCYGVHGTVGFTAGTTYTLTSAVKAGSVSLCQVTGTASCFPTTAYANFDLSGNGAVVAQGAGITGAWIRKLANGWFLCSIAAPATSTASGTGIPVAFINTSADTRAPNYNTLGATLIMDHGQVEAGAFPTSLIPTWGAAATRAGEVCSYNNSPYNNVEGTLYAEFDRMAIPASPPGYNQSIARLCDGTSNNFVGHICGNSAPATHQFFVQVAGAQQSNTNCGSGVAFNSYKVAARYGTLGVRGVQNAVLGGTGVGSYPTASSQMQIGHSSGAAQLGGHIRKAAYYPRAYSDAELQALTT